MSRLRFVALILALTVCSGCDFLPIRPFQTKRVTEHVDPDLPGRYEERLTQFLFLSDFRIQRGHPIFRDLATLSEQVNTTLSLPPSTRLVKVYLFEDRVGYESFMKKKYPQLPTRRAFFVAQRRHLGAAEDLMVFTYWGDRVQQDLRHELTHALLHSNLKNVPLWLDEGLAEYFELPITAKGVNKNHLEQLRQARMEGYRPNMNRLEGFRDVQDMSPAEYREAWGWVHFMLHTTPRARKVLLSYLQELRTNADPGPLHPRLASVFLSLDAAFESHLDSIALTSGDSAN